MISIEQIRRSLLSAQKSRVSTVNFFDKNIHSDTREMIFQHYRELASFFQVESGPSRAWGRIHIKSNMDIDLLINEVIIRAEYNARARWENKFTLSYLVEEIISAHSNGQQWVHLERDAPILLVHKIYNANDSNWAFQQWRGLLGYNYFYSENCQEASKLIQGAEMWHPNHAVVDYESGVIDACGWPLSRSFKYYDLMKDSIVLRLFISDKKRDTNKIVNTINKIIKLKSTMTHKFRLPIKYPIFSPAEFKNKLYTDLYRNRDLWDAELLPIKKESDNGMTQCVGNESIGIQAGGDLTINYKQN